MTKFIDGGYIDLDKEVLLDKNGNRITEADAEAWSQEAEIRSRGGRPSLSGQRKRSPQLGVRVSDETLIRLHQRAGAEGKKVSELVREAIEHYV